MQNITAESIYPWLKHINLNILFNFAKKQTYILYEAFLFYLPFGNLFDFL